MIKPSERLLHVHYLFANHWKTLLRLLQIDPSLVNLYSYQPSDFETLLHLTPSKALRLFTHLRTVSISFILQELQRKNVFYVTIFDEDYPALLKEIADPPFVLYGKGERSLLKESRKLAVVGARNPTAYGNTSVHVLLQELLQQNWIIVSGLAKGIDTTAHEAAIQYKGKTIAVLGGGFDYIYPKENEYLAQTLKNEHLLLTEYPPHYRSQKWYFPKRNRIISGLSLGVLVVEGKERSGSLITADCAIDQNREVFAVPGPITSLLSVGTNRLIQQGAKLVLCAGDIEEELKK
ncbi:DNA-processing protein DprA [Bacillus sp. 165]|uniref:DNA-processing protein DprA n=1 Tax=Bacillus sp. 165 TaxID=1529117 RepID=UPI001ADA3019|nr:DNA-processing protein DprA [Bacillus sp. 165]MBO9130166.1 DNA-processing protein DprA [Bacillus sp. 165]